MYLKKNLYIYILVSFFLHAILYAQERDDCKNKSDEFMFVFSNPNSLKDNGRTEEVDMTCRLYIEGIPSTSIRIDTQKYTIPPDGYLIIEDSFPPVPYEYSDKNVIKIKADSPISVYAERVSKFSAHSLPLIPVSQWGKEYTIPGYKDQSYTYKVNNFIDIIALNKKTQVSITDAKGNSIKKLTLKAGQNYEYNSTDDLTGYSVTADKNIGVISGNHCLRISAACDHTALMLKDNSKLGSYYYNPGTSFFANKTIHRLVATRNNTRVKIDGKLIPALKKGEFYEYRSENPHVIESSAPILVYLLFDARSISSPEDSVDPSSILIPPIGNSVTSTRFAFPDNMIYSKDIQVIMKTDKTHTLRLDDSILDAEWKTFPYDSSVSYATLSFSDSDIHRLSTTEPDAAFIPLLMARGLDISLGTALKTGFHDLFTGKSSDCYEKQSLSRGRVSFPQDKIKEVFLTDSSKPILVEKEVIDIFVFDNAEEDGDRVSIYLNEQLIYPDVRVLKEGINLEVTLEKGVNILTIKAENEGSIYPNTAGFTFDDGRTLQTIILHNKKGQSVSLKIISR
ncbi:MAG: IgGFc-binding protein [Flavobacteriaceae bacterium]|jgi:hypothetical protein|nr:IgGFc-binding protein [Flavobacteriaceae bacterium]